MWFNERTVRNVNTSILTYVFIDAATISHNEIGADGRKCNFRVENTKNICRKIIFLILKTKQKDVFT